MWCRFRVHLKVINHRKFTATLGGKNSLTKEKVFSNLAVIWDRKGYFEKYLHVWTGRESGGLTKNTGVYLLSVPYLLTVYIGAFNVPTEGSSF